MSSEIEGKVLYFETVTQQFATKTGEERARIRKELIEYYDSLSPSSQMAGYAAGGAVVAAILPGIGWIAGGLIGGALGMKKAHDKEVVAARERLGHLIEQVG